MNELVKIIDNSGLEKTEKQTLVDKFGDYENDLYLEPLNFDFDDVSSNSSTFYMFQEAINNIIKVLNKVTKKL